MRRRKAALAVLALILSLYLFSSRSYLVSLDGVISGVQPLAVWEFVMDFNNMKHLNPTIMEFWILSDAVKGNAWEYEVMYTEYLHQLPFITNTAIAKYFFLPVSDKEYHINSSHTTCFFANITCVYSRSVFIFREEKSEGEATYCRETVEYECPRILAFFCHNEVMFQRRSIFENLGKYLSGTS